MEEPQESQLNQGENRKEEALQFFRKAYEHQVKGELDQATLLI